MEIGFSNGKRLKAIVGDITKVTVDAIVNAANSGLRGGGGVDGAVHRAGGPSVMKELDEIRAQIGGCPTGSAVPTAGGNLPARYVFHAVGPIYQGGRNNEAELLGSCYETCLRLAEERNVRSISFPAISTGVYGYPLEEAAAIALDVVTGHLAREESKIAEVIFVLFNRANYDIYARLSKTQSAGR